MKSVIFTEEQLQNLDEITQNLFYDEQDPRSLNYVRKLNRPKINWIRIILYVLLPVIAITAFIIVANHFGVSAIIIAVIAVVACVVYVLLTLKRAIICAVKIYQRYAPDSVRNNCRFEPSCSEYMILAVEKYGVFKGVRKGLDRLKRCNVDGGGFDYP